LIDVASFNTLVSPFIKENSVLSHDHLEGWLSKVALVMDARLIESAPLTWYKWQVRQTRWMKGDLLLMPWICKGWDGPRNCGRRLSALARWTLFENLVALATQFFIFLFVLAATLLSGVNGWIVAIAAIVLINPHGPLFSPFSWSLFGRKDTIVQIANWHDAKQSLFAWGRRVGVAFLFLYGNALAYLRALSRALDVLLGNKKHVLDWEYSNPRRQCYREIFELVGLGLLIFGLQIALSPHRLLAICLAGAWLSSPLASCVQNALELERAAACAQLPRRGVVRPRDSG
jgi:hypothetical protein